MSKLDDAIKGGVEANADDAWHVYMDNLIKSVEIDGPDGR